MLRFRSLLIDRVNLRMPGLQVLRLAVHRHLAEHASVELHRHTWCQAIVYLRGAGVQTIGETRARIEAGSLVVLPPGRPHAFERRRGRTPLCVLVDFRLRTGRKRAAVVRALNRSELAQLGQQVAILVRLQTGVGDALRLEGAPPVLQILLTILRAAGWIDRMGTAGGERRNPAIEHLLATLPETESLTAASRQSGYHRDHLNRLVKQETGLTLGQYRAQRRLVKAKELLGTAMQVAHVGSAVGFQDQSYFARWFRRQTGLTPTAWSRKSSLGTDAQ